MYCKLHSAHCIFVSKSLYLTHQNLVFRVFSSVGLERYLDRVEVTGSNPVTPTYIPSFFILICNLFQIFDHEIWIWTQTVGIWTAFHPFSNQLLVFASYWDCCIWSFSGSDRSIIDCSGVWMVSYKIVAYVFFEKYCDLCPFSSLGIYSLWGH